MLLSHLSSLGSFPTLAIFARLGPAVSRSLGVAVEVSCGSNTLSSPCPGAESSLADHGVLGDTSGGVPVEDDVNGGGEVAEEDVLLSVICILFGFNPFLQNSITGLFVQTACFGLLPVKPSLSWSCVILSSFNSIGNPEETAYVV